MRWGDGWILDLFADGPGSSHELPGPSAKRSKIQPSVSFAEITKNRVLLGLIDRGNPEGRIPRNKWKAVESHLSFI